MPIIPLAVLISIANSSKKVKLERTSKLGRTQKVVDTHLSHRTVVERSSRVVERDKQPFVLGFVVVEHFFAYRLAMCLTDFCVWQKILHAMPTEGDDDFGVNNFKLPEEVWQKVSLFLWQRVAIVWRTILYDICNTSFS